jgi:hypothetical protein
MLNFEKYLAVSFIPLIKVYKLICNFIFAIWGGANDDPPVFCLLNNRSGTTNATIIYRKVRIDLDFHNWLTASLIL